MKIWKRIILGFISVIVIMIIVDLDAILNNITIINQVKKLEFSNRIELSQSNKIAYSLQRIKSSIRELFIEGEDEEDLTNEIPHSKNIINTHLNSLTISMDALYEATKTGYFMAEEEDEIEGEYNELVMLDSLRNDIDAFKVSVNNLLVLFNKNQIEEADILFENETELMSRKMQEVLETIIIDAEEEIEWAIIKLDEEVTNAIKLGISLTVLSIFLAFGIGIQIARSISKPLSRLMNSAIEIGKGNYKTKVEIHSYKELQLLADSFNNMATEIRKKISSINSLNKELVKSNKSKDTFFSIIAHDLKSPFNVILGYANILTNQYNEFDDTERKKFISEINKSSKLTYELLENLLAWAKSQSGKIVINKKAINLASIINECTDTYRAAAKIKNIKILNNISDEIVIIADKYTLTTVINNIMNNAIKFTPNGGEIRISAKANNNSVEVSIKDTGIGISQTTINNLFQSKQHESTIGTNNESGSGLGLILIKDFIEKNNGQLRIEGDNNGSEFKFSLPN